MPLASCIPAINAVLKAAAEVLGRDSQPSPALADAWAGFTAEMLAVLQRSQTGQANAKKLLATFCNHLFPAVIQLRHICNGGRCPELVKCLDAITLDSLFHRDSLELYATALRLPPLFVRQKESAHEDKGEDEAAQDEPASTEPPPKKKKKAAAAKAATAEADGKGKKVETRKRSYPKQVFAVLETLLADEKHHDAACDWMPQLIHQYSVAAQRAAQAQEGKTGSSALSWHAVASALHVDPRDVLFNLMRETHAILNVGAERPYLLPLGAAQTATFARVLAALTAENGYDEAFDKTVTSHAFSAWASKTSEDVLGHIIAAQAEAPLEATQRWLVSAWNAVCELIRCSQTFIAPLGPLLVTAALQRLPGERGRPSTVGRVEAVVEARTAALSVWTEAYSDLRQLSAVIAAVAEAGAQWVTDDFLAPDAGAAVGPFRGQLPYMRESTTLLSPWDGPARQTFDGWMEALALAVEEQPPQLGPRLLRQLVDVTAACLAKALDGGDALQGHVGLTTLLLGMSRSVACHTHVTALTVADIVDVLGGFANSVLAPTFARGGDALQHALEAPLCELICDALEVAQVAHRVDALLCPEELLAMLAAWRDSVSKGIAGAQPRSAGRGEAPLPAAKAQLAHLALDGQLLRQHSLAVSTKATAGHADDARAMVALAAKRKAQAILDGNHATIADALVDLKLLVEALDRDTLLDLARAVARLACEAKPAAGATAPPTALDAAAREAYAFATSTTLPELASWQAPWTLALLEIAAAALAEVKAVEDVLKAAMEESARALLGGDPKPLLTLGAVYSQVGHGHGVGTGVASRGHGFQVCTLFFFLSFFPSENAEPAFVSPFSFSLIFPATKGIHIVSSCKQGAACTEAARRPAVELLCVILGSGDCARRARDGRRLLPGDKHGRGGPMSPGREGALAAAGGLACRKGEHGCGQCRCGDHCPGECGAWRGRQLLFWHCCGPAERCASGRSQRRAAWPRL